MLRWQRVCCSPPALGPLVLTPSRKALAMYGRPGLLPARCASSPIVTIVKCRINKLCRQLLCVASVKHLMRVRGSGPWCSACLRRCVALLRSILMAICVATPAEASNTTHAACPGTYDNCSSQETPAARRGWCTCSLLTPSSSLACHAPVKEVLAAPRAGKPSLVLPVAPCSDQPFWAALVRRRGLGPAGFPLRKLTPERLRTAIGDGLAGMVRPSRHVQLLPMPPATHERTTASISSPSTLCFATGN